MPHIFLTEVLPLLKTTFPGKIKTALIQHLGKLRLRNTMDTSLLPPEKEDVVLDWTNAGKFPGADIVRHSKIMVSEPAMPSRRLAIEYALDQNADLHLWLEDDAIVCGSGISWPEEMNGKEVGVFKQKEYVNTAYFISSPFLDRRLVTAFSESSRWDLNQSMYHEVSGDRKLNLLSPRVEPFISRIAKRPWGRLTGHAERINFRKPESILRLNALLARICPGKVSLTEFDYPDITNAVPAIRVGSPEVNDC